MDKQVAGYTAQAELTKLIATIPQLPACLSVGGAVCLSEQVAASLKSGALSTKQRLKLAHKEAWALVRYNKDNADLSCVV